MIICNDCGKIFEDEKINTEDFGLGYVCPCCGSGDLSETVQCDCCSNYVSKSAATRYTQYIPVKHHIFVCVNCKNNILVVFDKLITENFDEKEKTVLAGEGLYGDDIV